MSQASDWIRIEFGKGDDIRDAGLTTPEGVLRYDDIVYGDDPKWQVLDVYRPADRTGEMLPVIVSVHGGGWVYGDKERYQYYCMDLAERGFAVVNFTYRLAPENKFPAPLEDTAMVFRWMLENREAYGFDTEYVFAVGDSVGAHILGMFCNMCTNPAYASRFPFDPPGDFVPAAVALNCGCYIIDNSPGPDGTADMTNTLVKDFLTNPEDPAERELINVADFVTERFPSAYVMTCTGDFLIDQPAKLSAKLTEKSVPHLCRFFGDKDHSLGHVFHCDIRSVFARRCTDEECAFFRSFIRPGK